MYNIETDNYQCDFCGFEEKWDDIRRSLIDQIISTEKQVTGKSDHKPEKKGWFD